MIYVCVRNWQVPQTAKSGWTEKKRQQETFLELQHEDYFEKMVL